MTGKIVLLVIAVTLSGFSAACQNQPSSPLDIQNKGRNEKPDAGRRDSSPDKSASSTKSPNTTIESKKTVQAGMKTFAFEPAEIRIKPNDAIVWKNLDSAGHSIHADDDSFKSDLLAPGQDFERTFNQPGEITFHCHQHPSTMKGKIIVE